MPRNTTGSPAVQSSSGVMLSYSGIVKSDGDGNCPPPNSPTILALSSLIEPFVLALRNSSARRKISETVIWLAILSTDGNYMRPNTTQSKALSRYQLIACLQASEKLVF